MVQLSCVTCFDHILEVVAAYVRSFGNCFFGIIVIVGGGYYSGRIYASRLDCVREL